MGGAGKLRERRSGSKKARAEAVAVGAGDGVASSSLSSESSRADREGEDGVWLDVTRGELDMRGRSSEVGAVFEAASA